MRSTQVLRLAVFALAAAAVVHGGACPKTAPTECASDESCADGELCVPDLVLGYPICAAVCAADVPCANGFSCVVVDGRFEGACLGVQGDITVGSACTEDRECASGACIGDTNRICAELCTLGAPCENPSQRCTLDGLRAVCAEPTDNLGDGMACTGPRACTSGICLVVPQADPDAAEEAICAAPCSAASPCGGSETCVRLVTGGSACLQALEDGALCGAAGSCTGGFCIEDIDGAPKCASACTDGACADGFTCVTDLDSNAVCMPNLDTRPAGEACADRRECADGHCNRFVNTDGVELGTLCADVCPADGDCGPNRICWIAVDADEPDVCGPVP